MKLQGKILNWNDDKGFGFVEPTGGGEKAFVHIKYFSNRTRRPVNGDPIIFEVVREKDNRYKATNVKFADEKGFNKRSNADSRSTCGIYFILIFSGAILASIYNGKLPIIFAGLYVLMSMLTFIAYAIDKSAAQNGRSRTKEKTLHLLSLIGGWPGAFFAQYMLRHKSIKKEFKLIYKATVLLNIGALIWFHTEEGSIVINKIFLFMQLKP